MKSLILQNKKIVPSLIWRTLKWHTNYFFSRRPLTLACGLYITNRCNLRCSFCNIWRKEALATLSLVKAKNIVDNLSDLGCFYFSISGGEPLLVDYLDQLLRYARKSKIKYIHLVTNGYSLDAQWAKRLGMSRINEISISIDGNEQYHDRKRGVPGAYTRALKAIENLKKYAPGIKVVLNAVLSPQQPRECLHLIGVAREFNVYLKVQPLNQHPVFNKENSSRIHPQDISAGEMQEVLTRLRREERVINSNAFLDNIYNFFFQNERLIFKDSACIFGYHHLEVLEDGSVFPCLEGLGWKGGIDFDGDLKGLLHSAEYKKLLEGLKSCEGCRRNYYICYYEPRISFPINNFLRLALKR
jgi:MoaA/NifB/PqqE/SkfB family radical SAM enzyme